MRRRYTPIRNSGEVSITPIHSEAAQLTDAAVRKHDTFSGTRRLSHRLGGAELITEIDPESADENLPRRRESHRRHGPAP